MPDNAATHPAAARILVVDDDRSGGRLVANHVDVILSDQRMPKMTGTEFLRRARAIHPDTIRIVLSGYTEINSITDAINEGSVYKFLTKPWDDETLRATLREAFERHAHIRESARAYREAAQINQDMRARVQRKAREFGIDISPGDAPHAPHG